MKKILKIYEYAIEFYRDLVISYCIAACISMFASTLVAASWGTFGMVPTKAPCECGPACKCEGICNCNTAPKAKPVSVFVPFTYGPAATQAIPPKAVPSAAPTLRGAKAVPLEGPVYELRTICHGRTCSEEWVRVK